MGDSHGERRVLIVGGGIGGLAAASALHRAGVGVIVLEAAPELPLVGAGLAFYTNGMLAVERLGLRDRIDAVSVPLEDQEFRNVRDDVLYSLRPADLARDHGVPSPVHLRRPDLLRALLETLPPGTVRTGSRVTGIDQRGAGVTVQLADGREERASLVVAADGADSSLRRTLFPEAPDLRYAGYRYLRALCDFTPDEVRHKFVLWTGKGRWFGVHSGDTWMYWFGSIVVPRDADDTDRKRRLQEAFAAFPPLVGLIIDETAAELINRADIRDLETLDRWSEGRVTLLGDAAHALAPAGGRGAGEAMEDAFVLADCVAAADLADDGWVQAALQAYEQRRRPAVAEVLKFTRRVGRSLTAKNPLAVTFRDRVITPRILPRVMPKELAREFSEYRRRFGLDETRAQA